MAPPTATPTNERHPHLAAFREAVRDFLTDEVLGGYEDWRGQGHPPQEFWRRAGELGILGIGVPSEYGGLPHSDFRHSAVVTEEVQRLGMAIGGLRVHTDICLPYLIHFSNQAQKQEWLPRMTSGRCVAALALSEPGAGSDVKAITTRADRTPGGWVLNGAKTFISNGWVADLAIVAAKTDPDAGRDGISLFLVDTTAPGFGRGRKLEKLGLEAQDLAELTFTNLRLPHDALLGAPDQGFSMLMANLAQERLSIGLNSQAAALFCMTRTRELLRGTRVSQSDKFALAGLATELAAGQALIDRSVEALVEGHLTPHAAAMAKLYCTQLQHRVVATCLEIAGSGALNRGDVLGEAFVNARVSRIYGGSDEIMRVIVAQGMDL